MRQMKYRPESKERRIITKFLWLPITIYGETGGYDETRWLEVASIEQEYRYYPYPVPHGWENVQFVDPPK